MNQEVPAMDLMHICADREPEKNWRIRTGIMSEGFKTFTWLGENTADIEDRILLSAAVIGKKEDSSPMNNLYAQQFRNTLPPRSISFVPELLETGVLGLVYALEVPGGEYVIRRFDDSDFDPKEVSVVLGPYSQGATALDMDTHRASGFTAMKACSDQTLNSERNAMHTALQVQRILKKMFSRPYSAHILTIINDPDNVNPIKESVGSVFDTAQRIYVPGRPMKVTGSKFPVNMIAFAHTI